MTVLRCFVGAVGSSIFGEAATVSNTATLSSSVFSCSLLHNEVQYREGPTTKNQDCSQDCPWEISALGFPPTIDDPIP